MKTDGLFQVRGVVLHGDDQFALDLQAAASGGCCGHLVHGITLPVSSDVVQKHPVGSFIRLSVGSVTDEEKEAAIAQREEMRKAQQAGYIQAGYMPQGRVPG